MFCNYSPLKGGSFGDCMLHAKTECILWRTQPAKRPHHPLCILAGKRTPCYLGPRKSPSLCQTVGHQAVPGACGQLELLQYSQVCKGEGLNDEERCQSAPSSILATIGKMRYKLAPGTFSFLQERDELEEAPSELRSCWFQGRLAVAVWKQSEIVCVC